MSFLLNNLKNRVALFALLFTLQLSTLPVSGRNLANIQRVTRNDELVYQPLADFQAADVFATTSEPFVANDEEILAAVEQETVDSGTDSPIIIQDDVNPFILVATDGHAEPVPTVEIVTPSFLNDVDESQPTVKSDYPSADPQLAAAEPFRNSLENLPTEVPEAQVSPDTSADPASIIAPEDLLVAGDSELDSAHVLEQSEPVLKIEDPLADGVSTSDEADVAPIAEDPPTDSVDVIVVPISDAGKVEHEQILKDPSVDPAIVAAVPVSGEAAAATAEDPSADPVMVVSAPIPENKVEMTQKLENDPLIETKPLVPSIIASEDSFAVKVPTEDDVPSVAQQELPPSSPPVFISSVSPSPVSPPAPSTTEKVASAVSKVTTLPIAYPVTGKPKVTQQKQPAVYSKPPTKHQVHYKYQPIAISSSSPRPSPAYGPPRTSPIPQSSSLKSFPTRPFGSSPKPRQLGFPPISSTRDNVLLEVNWNGKLGRPYRQAKLH